MEIYVTYGYRLTWLLEKILGSGSVSDLQIPKNMWIGKAYAAYRKN